MKTKLTKALKIKILKRAIWRQQRSRMGMCETLYWVRNSLGLWRIEEPITLKTFGITKKKYLDRLLAKEEHCSLYWYRRDEKRFNDARVSHLKAALKELQKR